MVDLTIENRNAGQVNVAEGKNPRILYEHQIDAMRCMNEINKQSNFSSFRFLILWTLLQMLE